MKGAKILIVEDEVAIAIDISLNLKSHNYTIVNVVHNIEDAIIILQNEKVDLVMLDINLNGVKSGIDLAEILDNEYNIPFIYLTSYSDSATLEKAAKTNPATYLVKPFKDEDLAPAVKIALSKKQNRLPSMGVINKSNISKITPTEYKIIESIWKGQTNNEIAENHFISLNTIKTHLRNIYLKFDIHSRSELIKKMREFR